MSQQCDNCAILKFIRCYPALNDLVFWKRPIESGCAFLLGLGYLISLATLSLISVVAYTCLALLCCTAGYRLYAEFIGKRKAAASADGDADSKQVAIVSHPFEKWLSKEFELPKETSTSLSEVLNNLTVYINKLRRVLIMESYMESLMFAAAMYIIARIGAWFNLLTLCILAFVILFTVPKVYELYQPQIDKALEKAKTEIQKLWCQVRAKLETLPVIGGKLKAN